MRKAKPKKRYVLPDPKFRDVTVTKFVNNLMYDGKKSLAYDIFYSALELVEKRTSENGLEAWKKALEQLQLQGENGHVKPADNAAMLRKLMVTSIPRYVIIDKNGKIIAPDAPRPSSPDTLNELLKLIDN